MKNGLLSKITKTADGAVSLRFGPVCIHREDRAVRLELGRLWFIRCAPNRPSTPGHPPIAGHPNVWMIVWRRRLPEWDPKSYAWLHQTYKTEAERHAYFAAKFPRVKEPNVTWRGERRDENGNTIPAPK